ncbi:PREDICTED: uncharacterized protein LOC106745323 [Dinoponera quadriceps]|uniref:Uncharacterized protein LOC106745323 n=1 Tax=Dinoponera quadriceps TaxID=609295 RepID=A0A6P3XDR9_DINQU|nr:PREDICTED: uncharacterized protein LOC106745323 [Dinoponera quadriceps]
MMRIYFLAVLILRCVSYPATSELTTWLMQGDLFTDEEATSQLIQLDTHKTYYPVNTIAEVSYTARRGEVISCVIAAAVHQHGHVHVIEGGYKTRKVRVRYTTMNGRPDILFVLIQAVKREPVFVEGNVARSTRLSIVHEPIRNWTIEEVRNSMRNFSSSFFPL